MNKPGKTSFALLVVLTALALMPLEALREQVGLAQVSPEPMPSFSPPETLAPGTTLSIDGSPTMEPINESLEASFEARYPGSDIILSSSGAQSALAALQAGQIDLAALGRPLSEAEMAQGLMLITVSREKIAIIVGDQNPFSGDITSEQFVQIFRGEITNWAQLGGQDQPIRFIDRPENSDIRQAFSEYAIFKTAAFTTGENAIQVDEDSTVAVVRELGDDGISYAIASEVENQQNVRVLSLHGTLPDNDLYPYSEPRGYVYRGEPSIAIEAFLGHANNSPEGQQAVAEAKDLESASVATADILPGVIAVNPNGQTIVRGTADGQLEWLNSQGEPTGVVREAHRGQVTGVAFSPDGQFLVSSGADGSILRWDPQGNAIGDPIQASDEPVTSLMVSPDGQSIISGANNGVVQKWSLSDGAPQGNPIQVNGGPVRDLTFAPDGQTLLTGGADGAVSLWNIDGSLVGKASDVHEGGVTALTTSPDGQLIVSGGNDGAVQFWNAAGSPQGDPIAAHDGAVIDIDFSPDGQTLATIGRDGLLKQWDRNGSPIEVATVPLDEPAAALDYTPEGDLVTSQPNGNLDLRDRFGQPISDAEAAATDDSPFQLPPIVDRVFRGLGLAPESTWWILAAVPLLLIGSGVIWSLLGNKSRPPEEEPDREELEDEEPGEAEAEAERPEIEVTAESVFLAEQDQDFGEDEFDLQPSLGEAASFIDSTDDTYPTGDDDIPPSSGFVDSGLADSELLESAESKEASDRLAQARTALTEGKRLQQEARYEEALSYFNNALEAVEVERYKALSTDASLGGVSALLAAATAGRGSALSMLGQTDSALSSFDHVLEIDERNLEAWIGKGRMLMELGRLDEALFSFDQALDIAPESWEAWAGKGHVLQQLNRQSEGQSCLQKAAELSGSEGLDTVSPPLSPAPSPSPTLPMPPRPPSPVPVTAVEPDIPPELLAAIETLPNEGEIIDDAVSGVPLPADMQAVVEDLRDDPESSDGALTSAIAPGLSAASPAIRKPLNPEDAELPPPEELDEVIEALQDSSESTFSGDVSFSPPAAPPAPSRPPASTPIELESRVKADNPDASKAADPTTTSNRPPNRPDAGNASANEAFAGDALASAPPTVRGVLQGIPPDSLDDFDPPSETVPKPSPISPVQPKPPTQAVAQQLTQPALRLSIEGDRLYAVWSLAEDAKLTAKQSGGIQFTLRLYDVSQTGSNQLGQPVTTQVCPELAEDWYLSIPACDRAYVAEVGYRGVEDAWFSLAISEPLHVPCG